MEAISNMRAKIAKRNKSDIIFDIFNYTLLSIIGFLVLYPLYFIVIASVSDPDAVNNGMVTFFPVGFNVSGYEKILADKSVWTAYRNTIFYTVVGTSLNLILTMMIAYPLSRKRFSGKTFITIMIMITMYFQGGMIPTYLLVQNLNLYNTPWVMILLPALNVFNIIIAKTNIQHNIPEELYEAASIDGCSHIRFFWMIVIPLSKTLLAILVLYYGVAHWNEFMNGLLYLRDDALYPLQLVLRGILVQNQAAANMVGDIDSMMEAQKTAELIKYGLIIVSALPILSVYPFLQKYFEKGVMVGSVKG